MKKKNRIFLAHASEDKLQVRELYNRLEARNFYPWMDQIDLVPGQDWERDIKDALRHADICLACLSKQAVGKEGFVQKELRYAMSVQAEKPPNSIYLIPVLLNQCEIPDLQFPELLISLRSIYCVHLYLAGGFDRLISAIQEKIGIQSTLESIFELNNQINEVMILEKTKLERQRVQFHKLKGYVQTAHITRAGVRVDLILDDQRIIRDVDALSVLYEQE